MPEEAIIPLVHASGHLDPLISVGEGVVTGQLLAADDATVMRSSLTGTVTAIGSRPVAGKDHAPCVVIRRSDPEIMDESCRPADPAQMDAREIIARIREGGILGLGGALFSAARKLDAPGRISTLVINGVECEPWISCDEMLLRERATVVLRGTIIMMKALGAERAVIAINVGMNEARVALADVLETAGDDRISLALVTARYPAGGERQLVQLLGGVEVPAGGLPHDIGYLCQNAGTAAAVAELFDLGRPLISRIVTVTGTGIREPGNFEVRIGTPIATLLQAAGGCHAGPRQLIMGGPMMGIGFDDETLPVTPATNCVAVLRPAELAPAQMEMPCIRCGACVEVCPAHLMPNELLGAVQRHDGLALAEFGLDACIECGSCDHVCPSAIALTPRFAAARARRASTDDRESGGS